MNDDIRKNAERLFLEWMRACDDRDRAQKRLTETEAQLTQCATALKQTEDALRRSVEGHEKTLRENAEFRSTNAGLVRMNQELAQKTLKGKKQLGPNDLIDSYESEMSLRTHHCLAFAGMQYIGELSQKKPHELLKIKNFGRRSLKEVKKLLAKHGLTLGTPLPDWKRPK
jgi:DNA-directed RNA polymerase alpha subunit